MARNPSGVKASAGVLEAIAAVAHRLWREKMTAKGWRWGREIDHDTRTHPGLRPFEELTALERDLIIVWIESEGLEGPLYEVVAHAFNFQQWSAADLHVGTRVQMLNEETGEPSWEVAGTITELEIGNPESGRLELITVQWDDGSVGTHSPGKHELMLARTC